MPNIASPAFPYGPGTPTINGRDITLDWALKDPTYIPHKLQDLTSQQFLTEYLYTVTPTPSGVLLADRVTDQDLYVNIDPNLQPGEIEPASEFPNVMVDEPAPTVSLTKHIGGQFPVTYRQVRRDKRDVLGRGLLKLKNTLIRQSSARALAVLLVDPDIPHDVWGGTKLDNSGFDGTGLAAFFSKQKTKVDNDDLNYYVTDVIINGDTASNILGADKIQSRLPRENIAKNPLLSGDMTGFLNVNWIFRRSCPADTAIFTQRKIVGTLGVERPLYSRVVNIEEREVYIVQAAYEDVPAVTDPLSTRIVTGLV